MKPNAYVSILLSLALILGLFTGCAAKSAVSQSYDMASPAEVMEAAGALEGAMDTGEALPQPDSRKWIITMDMSAETEDLDTLLSALTQEIGKLAGYVEDQSIHNGSAYASRRYRSASLTIRVPAGDVDSFTQAVAGIANVVSSSKRLEDVTLQYSDTKTRVKALETERDRLLELMEQAENLSDLLEIESRLTEVRYELERYSSRLKLYDNQIDYATICLSIDEVQEYTPVEEPTVWQRIRTGFVSSLKGLGAGIVDAVVWLIVFSPYLLVLGGIGACVVFFARRARKQRKAGKNQP